MKTIDIDIITANSSRSKFGSGSGSGSGSGDEPQYPEEMTETKRAKLLNELADYATTDHLFLKAVPKSFDFEGEWYKFRSDASLNTTNIEKILEELFALKLKEKYGKRYMDSIVQYNKNKNTVNLSFKLRKLGAAARIKSR